VNDVDPDLVDLLPGYLRRRRRDERALREALHAGDFETVRRIGHNLKGSGGAYGLPEVSAIGRELEGAGRGRDDSEAARWTRRLAGLLDQLAAPAPGGSESTPSRKP